MTRARGGNERSEPVETDDIDSFLGGKPLAGCPIGAPTLHPTNQPLNCNPAHTLGPPATTQKNLSCNHIKVNDSIWSFSSEAMSRPGRLTGDQLDLVLLLPICTQSGSKLI